MIKKEKYSQILFLFFLIINFSSVYCQNIIEKKFSYAIWVHEYKKGWIDSEDSYWILESPNDINFDFLNKSFNSTYLLISNKSDLLSCCNSYKNISVKFNNEVDFFNQKETFKIKVSDATISILALQETNCLCTTESINKYSGVNPPKNIIVLLTADFLRISKKQKKNLKKNKLEWIEYFKNLD